MAGKCVLSNFGHVLYFLTSKAAEKVDDTDQLQREKIGYQKSIIELQQKLLQQTENELKNLKEAV